MNYPLLNSFNVDEEITEQLIKSYTLYKELNPMADKDKNNFSNNEKYSGYQTSNLLHWENNEFQSFLKNIFYNCVSKQLGTNLFSYYWAHYLEYENGGSMDIHKHWHNEDFVLFIYLSTCSTGHTVFYLNDYNKEHMERTCVRIPPVKGTGACFSSLLAHEGEFTYESKKIFVVGIRLNH